MRSIHRGIAAATAPLVMVACASTRGSSGCLPPLGAGGWYASGADTMVIWPSAAGGEMLSEPSRQRLRHLTPGESGTYRARRGNQESAVVLLRDSCGVSGLTVRTDGHDTTFQRVDAPYGHREVRFRNGALELAGLLLAPTRPVAGAVMVHGSGASDRDNGWYLRVAHHLASAGIAVLVPDKRGSGQSAGSWEGADFHELAQDAVAGANALRRTLGSPSIPVGLVGVSQAGWVLPIALMESAAVNFGVSLVGPAVTLREQQRHVLDQSLSAARLPASLQEQVFRLEAFARRYMMRGEGWADYRALRDTIANGPLAPLAAQLPADSAHWSWDWGRRVSDVDPVDYWRGSGKPGLVILGTADPSVPAQQSAQRLEPLANVTVMLHEGFGHDLARPGTGRIDDEVLRAIVTWIRARG